MRSTRRERRPYMGAVLGLAAVFSVAATEGAGGRETRRGPPPFRPMTIEEIEPPRDVAAAEYRSPFCLRWHDGCTTCERPSVTGEVACAPRPGASPACERHAIVCKRVGGAFSLYCKSYISGTSNISEGVGWWRGCLRPVEIDPAGLMQLDSMNTFYGRTYGVPASQIRERDLSGIACIIAREKFLDEATTKRHMRNLRG